MQDHVRTHAPSGTLVPVGRLRPANGLSGFTGRVYFSREMKIQANNQKPIPKPGQPVFLWFFRTVRNEPEPVVRQTPESHPPPERAGDERRTTNARWTSHRRVEQSPRRRSGCDRSAPKPSGGLLNRTMRELFPADRNQRSRVRAAGRRRCDRLSLSPIVIDDQVKCRTSIQGVCKRFGKGSRAVSRDGVGAYERSPEHGAINVYRRLADKIATSVVDDESNASYVRWSTGRVGGARGGEPITPLQRCDRTLMLVVCPRGSSRSNA